MVIVQCPQCKSRHLLADNLGWFGGRGNIEDLMREKGQGPIVQTSIATVTNVLWSDSSEIGWLLSSTYRLPT